MPDIKKLPKWAQDKIAILEENLTHYKKELYKVESGETNTLIERYEENNIYLPKDSRITFIMDCELGRKEAELRVYINEDNKLVINGCGGIKHILKIIPRASNEIHIDLE
jgi:hypothetical protein